jgi:hypothetical protein
MAALSGYVMEPISGRRRPHAFPGPNRGNRKPVLVIAFNTVKPSPVSLRRFEHDYSLATV